MKNIEITGLYIYPIKSTYRIALEETQVENLGFVHDRSFALLDANNKIITARENPKLLHIRAIIKDNRLVLSADGMNAIELTMEGYESTKEEATIFSDQVSATVIHEAINDWITEVVKEPVKLIFLDEDKLRGMKAKYNAKEGDVIGFKDAGPIHIITEASVNALNTKLEQPVNIHHFRPNIVLKGTEAYEEDNWKSIKIGECEFQVAAKTGRCQFITINPETAVPDTKQEPLRTLARLRKDKNNVPFGINIIPRKLGVIRKTDSIEIDFK